MRKKRLQTAVMAWIVSSVLIVQPMVGVAATVVTPDTRDGHNPLVAEAQNGIPVVNIQTPNATGLSHNQYMDLQIGSEGLILNNSQRLANTELAGYINGNPYMGGVPASVILNEVTGNNRTTMAGAIEVAGQRADVVLANPNGISVNNGTFINTNQAILTTGNPIFNENRLTGFSVTQGDVTVAGQGLDAKATDRLDILANTASINTGIWAKNLHVVTGQNDITVGSGNTPNTVVKTGERTGVGLDVAAVGGMYANAITLVGTESGVGVNNAGTLQASEGQFTVSSIGEIRNAGTISSTDNASLTGTAIINTGALQTGHDASINAITLDNIGTIIATGHTNVTAQQTVTNEGRIGSGGDIHIHTQQLSNVKEMIANGHIDTNSTNLTNTGTIHADKTVSIEATNDVNTSGTIESQEEISTTSATLMNTGTIRSNGSIAMTANQALSQQGHVTSLADTTIETGSLINTGAIASQHSATIHADSVTQDNTGSIIASQLTVKADDTLSNTGLLNGEVANISAKALTNQETGRIYGTTLVVNAKELHNEGASASAPVIAARNNAYIGADHITNAEHAIIKAENELHMGKTAVYNPSTHVGNVEGKANTLRNSSATIEAGGDAFLAVETIENKNNHFATMTQLVNTETIEEVAGSRDGNRYTLTDTQLRTRAEGYDHLLGDDVVFVFEDESDHLFAKGNIYENWWKFNYERKTYEDVVSETDPGLIRAGGNLSISGNTLINDKSTLTAGKLLTTDVGNVQNLEAPGTRVYVDEGTQTEYWRDHDRGTDETGSRRTKYSNTESKEVIVPVTVMDSNTPLTNQSTGANVFTPVVSTTTANGSVLTTVPNQAVSNSSLHTVAPSTAHYYIETDPNYTNRTTFISSDYFLDQLQTDPEYVMKRLGDGYYEGQLVKDALLKLTGHSKLDSSLSDEEQYKALMDQGIAFGQSTGATIGVALTAEQQAQLTHSIVWFVETAVVLPSGEVVTALVPQVYVASSDTNTASRVGVISATDINMIATNEILNTGSIVAGNTAVLSANNINVVNGSIKGANVGLQASDSVASLGGRIQGENAVSIAANNDITLRSTTHSGTSEGGSITNISAISSVSTTGANSTVLINAGRDVNINASAISSEGNVGIQAGRDITLGTVTTSREQHIISDAKNQRHETETQDVGSVIGAKGDVALLAGQDVSMRGATIASNTDIAVTAGRTISTTSAERTIGLMEDHRHTGKSGGGNSQVNTSHDEMTATTLTGTLLSGDTISLQAGSDMNASNVSVVANTAARILAKNDVTITGDVAHAEGVGEAHVKSKGAFSAKKGDSTYTYETDTVNQSGISGDTVTIGAGNDVTVTASQVVSATDTTMIADGDVTLDTMKDVSNQTSFEQMKRTGFSASGLGVSYGTTKEKSTSASHSETSVGSTVASLEGSTTIQANQDIHATTATINGNTGVTMIGDSVTLDGKDATYYGKNTYERKQTGITVALGGSVASGIQTATQYYNQSKDRNDSKLAAFETYEAGKALQGAIQDIRGYSDLTQQITRAVDIKNASVANIVRSGDYSGAIGTLHQGNDNIDKATEKVKEDKDSIANLSVSIGSSKERRVSEFSGSQYMGGSVTSDIGAVTIVATGEADTSGNIKVIGQELSGKDVNLLANNDIQLGAGKNIQSQTSSSKSSGWNLGANVSFQTGNLAGIGVSASMAKSNEDGKQETYTNTHINATDTVHMKSGDDVILTGASVTGKRIEANVGGDLMIASLQDTNTYTSKDSSAGFSASIPMGGAPTVMANASKGKMNSNYASVTEQSGLYAGIDGFTIDVNGATSLTGAVIASKATADKNSLSTKSLVMKDIQNTVAYDVSSKGLTYTKVPDLSTMTSAEKNEVYNKMGLTPMLTPGASDEASSTTYSAIADGYLEIKDKNVNLENIRRDTTRSLNTLEEIFDRKTIEEKQELAGYVSKYGNIAIHKISDHYDWADGSPQKVALHTALGGLTSKLAGNSFSDGAYTAGVNEAIINDILNAAGTFTDKDGKVYKKPEMAQAISALVGYTANSILGLNANTGAYSAHMGTKWNHMFDNDTTEGQFKNFNDAFYALNSHIELEKANTEYNNNYSIKEEFESRYIDIAASIGSEIAKLSPKYRLAGIFLSEGLHGDGSDVTFYNGSLASESLINDPAFIQKVHELGEHIKPGFTESFYTSIEASPDNGNFYAFGHIKIALDISKQYDGTLLINGVGKDLWNYEEHPLDSFGDFINNQAFDLQRVGKLKPFVYTVKFNSVV